MLFEVVFGGNTENDMNDLSVLAEKDELTILTQLFQKDIDNIKTSKEDSEQNKLTEAYLKKINSIPSELLVNCLEVKVLAGFSQFDVVQSVERNVSIFT